MRVVLRRRLPDDPATGRQLFDQAVLEIDRLTLGRGADQIIQIPDARIAVEHAVIDWHKGRLRLRARQAPITVNGRSCRETVLQRGDVLDLAGRHVTVEDLRSDGVLVIRMGRPVDEAAVQEVSADPQSLKDAGLRASPLTWRLAAGMLLLSLILPLCVSLDSPLRKPLRTAPILPSDAFWLPGPLHTAHQSIGADCNACHVETFKRVSNESCNTCHAGVQQHVPASSAARPRFAAMQCADCHVEHDKSVPLVDGDAKVCTGCHENLQQVEPHATLKDASDFGKNHPGFSLALLTPVSDAATTTWRTQFTDPDAQVQEHSNLKFSHKVHLDPHGVKSPSGDQQLKCNDCHVADAGGRQMLPVRMETHCARCHQLQFDEHDPSTAVPHGDLSTVFTSLQDHFSRMFLQQGPGGATEERRRPGGEALVMSRDEQRRSLEWTTRQSLQAASELLDKRVCVECHTVNQQPGKSGFERWQVEPVKLTSSWMPRAQFNHAAHRSSACTDCHKGATQSDASSDVLMPRIQECRTCHGGTQEEGKLASSCIMCHRLHIPGRGDLLAHAP